MFKEFLADECAAEMFITGSAGTGKTTNLRKDVEYCIANGISYVVCSYTHKACDILRSVLPDGTIVQTLHAVLKKRPSINEHATKIQHLQVSSQQGIPERIDVMFLDEYSMLGEKDYIDIGAMQYNEEGVLQTKVVYLGDPNQLPPVGDVKAIYPSGKYQKVLTKVYRQGAGPLLDTLIELTEFIKGKPPEPLKEHEQLVRNIDLVSEYQNCKTDKILLAYTNQRVEELNASIAGKHSPDKEDWLYSPTLKHHYKLLEFEQLNHVAYINLPFNDDILTFDSKYKTLEHLLRMKCCDFYVVTDDEGEEHVYAATFGNYQYKLKLEEYANEAIKINSTIEAKYKEKAKAWALNNKHDPMAKDRAKAWRNYMTFKNCVACFDFPYAMTVHKSQGSTYDTVFVDTDNLAICSERDYTMYLKLMYVAFSRAKHKVYTT